MKSEALLARGAVGRLAMIDGLLDEAYGTPEAALGNRPDPLDEAVYIILSFQTDLVRFKTTWAQLSAAYPSWEQVERATERALARVLREGGLQNQKARTIKRLLNEVRDRMGELSLRVLREMKDADAERLLIGLPGLSWKGARCVLLYSLGRDVLPVDANIFRVLKRTGVLPRRAVYRRRRLHDVIQDAVPPARRRALHVNMVVHGQRTCLPRKPRCSGCPLAVECPRVGVSQSARASAAEERGAIGN